MNLQGLNNTIRNLNQASFHGGLLDAAGMRYPITNLLFPIPPMINFSCSPIDFPNLPNFPEPVGLNSSSNYLQFKLTHSS